MGKTSGQGVAHKPDDESRRIVKMLSAVGTRHEDIASKLDITDDTLRKHYRKELDDGRIDANASVAQTLFQQAKNGNTAAAIFWLKTRAQWRENVEISGPGGGPILLSPTWLTARSINPQLNTIEAIDMDSPTLPLAQAEIAPPGGIQTPPGGVSRGAADSDPLPPSNPGGGVVR